jgi:LacI family transcriptional regulator
VSTVSIVLNETPLSLNVAATTRQQIRTMAKQLGYHPDAFARSLRSRRSQTIGVVAYDLSDPHCIPIVRGIQAGLQPASYLPLLMDAQTGRGQFDSYLKMILERRAEGVIVIASWIFDEANLLSDIEKNNVPIMIVSRDLTARGVSSVLVDNEAGGACATCMNWAIAGSRSFAARKSSLTVHRAGPEYRALPQRPASSLMRGWFSNCPAWWILPPALRGDWIVRGECWPRATPLLLF